MWMYFSVSKSSFKVIWLFIFMPSRLVKITRLHSFIDGRLAQRSCHSVVFSQVERHHFEGTVPYRQARDNQLLHFPRINLLKMSYRKRWKWHFEKFLGEHAPRPPTLRRCKLSSSRGAHFQNLTLRTCKEQLDVTRRVGASWRFNCICISAKCEFLPWILTRV